MKLHQVQMKPRLRDKTANLRFIKRCLQQAIQEEVQLIAFTELCLTGYMCREAFAGLAEPIPGPSTLKIAQQVKRGSTYVLFGLPELREDSLFNSAVLIGPEGIAGVWRKNYLPQFVSKRVCYQGFFILIFFPV